ncbi:patatin-like phospholipase family protein [Enterococcus sp. LJL90]
MDMKFSPLYQSEATQWKNRLNQGQLVWPFFGSHSEARRKLIAQSGKLAAVVETASCHFFFSYQKTAESLIIDNLLVLRCRSQKQLLRVVEQVARSFFKKTLIIDFSQRQVSFQDDIFKQAGFQETADGLSKKLVYKNALVFGGGGSHGAYQVGVWMALTESHVPIQILTGASVGALNGALFAQGDLAAAKTLWQRMSTDHVLVFPKASEQSENLPSLLSQIGSLTTSAIKNRGVSAEPLRNILLDLYDAEKMRETTVDFQFVTTAIAGLRETRISYQPEFQKDWVSWLLASASFFPAMALQEIDGNYYMDGGYRNNIPVDIAYQKGATDCFVVDIKGPGLTKPVRQPEGVNLFTLHSPWSLGSFLLFSPERSQSNLTLGYLETRKCLGNLQGFWYSFLPEEDLEKEWQQFYQEFTAAIPGKKMERKEFLDRFSKIYGQKVVWETVGRCLLESAARYTAVAPTEIYDYATMKAAILNNLAGQKVQLYQELSITEWLTKYYQAAAFSDEEQVNRLLSAARQVSDETIIPLMTQAYQRNPLMAFFVCYLIYLKRGSQQWQKSFPMKS